MTKEVLILKRIAGHMPGEIAPYSKRLDKHIAAGNARMLTEAPAEPVKLESYKPANPVRADLPVASSRYVPPPKKGDEREPDAAGEGGASTAGTLESSPGRSGTAAGGGPGAGNATTGTGGGKGRGKGA